MNRGVRIPSLRGCGKKEAFPRIQRRKNIPGALVTFVTPSRTLHEMLNEIAPARQPISWFRPGLIHNYIQKTIWNLFWWFPQKKSIPRR
jgi:hypothetical protein